MFFCNQLIYIGQRVIIDTFIEQSKSLIVFRSISNNQFPNQKLFFIINIKILDALFSVHKAFSALNNKYNINCAGDNQRRLRQQRLFNRLLLFLIQVNRVKLCVLIHYEYTFKGTIVTIIKHTAMAAAQEEAQMCQQRMLTSYDLFYTKFRIFIYIC